MECEAWKQREEPAPVKIYLVAFLGVLALLIVALATLFAHFSFGTSLFVTLAVIPPVALAALVLPLTILLQRDWRQKIPVTIPLAFVIPAVALFVFACLVKTAPWEWDNIKLIIWAYLIVLPFLWSEVISRWVFPDPGGRLRAPFRLGLYYPLRWDGRGSNWLWPGKPR